MGFSQETLPSLGSTARTFRIWSAAYAYSMESIEKIARAWSFPSRHSSTAQAVEPTRSDRWRFSSSKTIFTT